MTAFDVSETAIKYCKERFPESTVDFVQADLLKKQTQWHKAFDFVLEIYAEVSNQKRSFENGPPWLLTPEHVEVFEHCGLRCLQKEVEQGEIDFENAKTYVSLFERNQDFM